MNKISFNSALLLILFAAFTSFSIAQSDYATVQKFKKQYEEIKLQIMDANSTEELDLIYLNVEKFVDTYSKNSELFNKALYPEKYEDMIAELNYSIALRESNFNEVEELKVEVTDLKQRVDTLSIMNQEMAIKFDELQNLLNKSTRETARLNNVIAQLKIDLHKRDLLVMSMVDSLMPPVMREKAQLSAEDKEKIISDIEKDNILVNIKATIKDNIKYLDLTYLQPEDIEEIQMQQVEFANTWARIGPRLAEVYSSDNNRTNELYEIDSLFNLWSLSVEKEVWQSMEEELAAKGIELVSFSDGTEFTNAVNQYIEKEKSSINTLTEDEAKNKFNEFAEKTWAEEIKPKWVLFLVENEMLDVDNANSIDDNIEVWRSELYPSNWWMWLIFAGIVLSFLAVIIGKLLKRGSQYDALTEEG